MKIRFSKPFTGQHIIDMFRYGLMRDDTSYRKWRIDTYTDAIEYSFTGSGNADPATTIGAIARLEAVRHSASDWHPVWPTNLREIKLPPLNPNIQYTELIIQIGMLPASEEATVLATHPDVMESLQKAMERFDARLYQEELAVA